MKKMVIGFTAGYAVYLIAIAAYFFIFTKTGVPTAAKGTAADPSLFMNAEQLARSATFNRWRHFLSFATIPLEWGLYLLLLVSGFSFAVRRLADKVSGLFVIRSLICFAVLTAVSAAVFLPINFISYRLSRAYGLSVQPLTGWLRDQGVDFAVNSLIGFIVVTTIFFFIRRNPRNWWLPVWLLAIPFAVFLIYIQPVVIDPLYHQFRPLPEGALKTEILQLASHAGIPANNVYETDMSTETKTMNAYVNGIGSHLRIVLWDTTVHGLSRREVLFVMAHEMGHYVMHHIAWSLAATLAGLLIGLWLTARLLLYLTARVGPRLNITHPGDLAALPLVLLLFALLSFAAEPVENAVSRQFEHAADRYALQLTDDPQAGISAFQKLSRTSLGEINPPALVKWLQYDHPTMLERIEYFEHSNSGRK